MHTSHDGWLTSAMRRRKAADLLGLLLLLLLLLSRTMQQLQAWTSVQLERQLLQPSVPLALQRLLSSMIAHQKEVQRPA